MLIVEDGTGKSDSDSYVSLVDARALAVKYGYMLPNDDTAAEVALRQGAGYIDMQELCFGGVRKLPTQALAWPRIGAKTTFKAEIANDAIPSQLLMAQVAAAAEYGAGVDVRATDDGKAIASEEVTGAVAVSYFNNGKTGNAVVITKAMDALKNLMTVCSNGFEFRVYR